MFTPIKPSTDQLITLATIETDLMVLNARVRLCPEINDIDEDFVQDLARCYRKLGEKYTLFCLESNINFHPINSAIVKLHRVTSFNFFWKEGVSNALERIEVNNCEQCATHSVCGIHG